MTNNDISKAYMGVSEVDKIYLGDVLIYPTTPPVPPEPVYSAMPLTFEIISGGTITWTKSNDSMGDRTLYYSTNSGQTWSTITSSTGGTSLNVSAGDKVMFESNNSAYATISYYTQFGGTAIFKAYGNIMSLVNRTGYTTATTISADYAFERLFYFCGGLADASNLVLPATTLTRSCYSHMFSYCTGLTAAPAILPATTLTRSCYSAMFDDCGLLTRAPELPAPTLANYCYNYMFTSCPNLNYIKCLATDISAEGCLEGWVLYVSATGTFIQSWDMEDWTIGVNGIPNGWTVEREDVCEDWENMGYESYEDCRCQLYGDECFDGCDDWENMGYGSYEDCRCVEYNECDACQDWEEQGYGSYDECNCAQYGECWNGEECVSCEDPEE